MARVQTGLERVLLGEADADLAGRRVGLIANPTAVDPELRHAADLLHAGSGGPELAALFGPEHGLRGDAQDMIPVEGDRDPATGLPVHSLYGTDAASLEPTDEQLDGLDALIFDIQDVGARYYTYVWTMVHAMRACARAGLSFYVLDRPNPISGTVEGGPVEHGFESFCGLMPLPNRHGMTAGEIARWARARDHLDVDLRVVEMRGWKREMMFGDTGLPWVMPSPNMPTVDTALVYPGMCLVEGTELSEGRGTTRPFELAGAPGVEPAGLASALGGLPGVIARPCVFTPQFQKHAKTPCGAVQLHVTDPVAFRPYLTGVAFVKAVHDGWPEAFAWRERAYEFVDDVPAFDILTGSAAVREAIEARADLAEIQALWQGPEDELRQALRDWLLY